MKFPSVIPLYGSPYTEKNTCFHQNCLILEQFHFWGVFGSRICFIFEQLAILFERFVWYNIIRFGKLHLFPLKFILSPGKYIRKETDMNIQNEAPIRALAIAPYESMAVSLVHAAESFPSIRLEVHTGDLEQGLEIVNRLDPANFDVIISRGGTAEMIRSVTDLPVVEISVSIYDVLRAIKLSDIFMIQDHG